MTLEIYTLVHVAISLVGIAAGFAVLFGLLARKRLDGWTKSFLITTVATSVTRFFFPFHGFTPAIGVDIISLLVLAVAIFARYDRNLAGSWRWIYVVTATIALYLNVFVGIVQAFQKVPALKAIAPMQTEPPFAITQLIVLVLFILIGIVAAIRFRPELTRAM
jgi:magnesium-transporting ATPase (P-type)